MVKSGFNSGALKRKVKRGDVISDKEASKMPNLRIMIESDMMGAIPDGGNSK
jgi:hypothetical protein